MNDSIVEPKGDSHIDPETRRKQLTTYMMLGQMMNEQLIREGLRAPDEPQIQLTGEGWRIWGGEYKEPNNFTVAELYKAMLKEGDQDQAQAVLDMTRERCGELRLAAKRARGKVAKELEGYWSKLRKELDEAIKVKVERGITTIE